MEVDHGGKIDPNQASSGCMLMQVDWVRKLRVDNINEFMLSEVDWGDYDSSFFLYLCTLIMMQSQGISSLKDCGEDYHKGHFPPLSLST